VSPQPSLLQAEEPQIVLIKYFIQLVMVVFLFTAQAFYIPNFHSIVTSLSLSLSLSLFFKFFGEIFIVFTNFRTNIKLVIKLNF